jgi:hypothetical protein
VIVIGVSTSGERKSSAAGAARLGLLPTHAVIAALVGCNGLFDHHAVVWLTRSAMKLPGRTATTSKPSAEKAARTRGDATAPITSMAPHGASCEYGPWCNSTVLSNRAHTSSAD